MKAGSAPEALEAVRELKQRNAPVALFLVDARMPHMSGTEFLVEAGKLYPDARKVLLTAYADTDVAIAGINQVQLDHYLMKPWDPPEERLYPVLDDLLAEWRSARPARRSTASASRARSGRRSLADVKDFLSRSQTPYQWVDVERDARPAALPSRCRRA